MELFYSDQCDGSLCVLESDESQHCVKVLRHRAGDIVNIIDGQGTMYECELIDASSKSCTAQVIRRYEEWGSHPYELCMAVCPTKNNDRYEWFVEKACEMGVDCIVPTIGSHSERKVFKTERVRKIILSACKQSLKAKLPSLCEPVAVREFIRNCDRDALRLIACCFEDETHPRQSIKDVLEANPDKKNIVVLIGPEGDFSAEELSLALSEGFCPVHFGDSRLRTETAAVFACSSVYFSKI